MSYSLKYFKIYLITDTKMLTNSAGFFKSLCSNPLKGVFHEIFWVLFWHVWTDLGLYKNL
jgi:hypothetical protein